MSAYDDLKLDLNKLTVDYAKVSATALTEVVGNLESLYYRLQSMQAVQKETQAVQKETNEKLDLIIELIETKI